jgi:hypothetical protein
MKPLLPTLRSRSSSVVVISGMASEKVSTFYTTLAQFVVREGDSRDGKAQE